MTDCSATTEPVTSVPFARLWLQRDWYWPLSGLNCEKDQLKACT